MIKKPLLLFSLLTLLVGCSSNPKPLNAPCTYNSRSGCGPIVLMQQEQGSK